MIYLILSLIFAASPSKDAVNNFVESVFAPASTPIKITRTHMTPEKEKLFKEYIYKDGDKIRIDEDYGDSTVTTFVYDGKTGYKHGRPISTTGSLEMILYGCNCSYLSALEKDTVSQLEGRNVLLAKGKQGNKLYIDKSTKLAIQFELRGKTAKFDEYKSVDGFGNIPYLVIVEKGGKVSEIIRITDVANQVIVPGNFFSVPKPDIEILN